jgi:phage terminase small subunit
MPLIGVHFSMPTLNARQEAFVRCLVEGKCQKQAYVDAGYKDTHWAETNASRLTRNDKVAARLLELQAKAADKAVLTRESIMDALKQVADRCMQAKPIMGRDGRPTGQFRFNASGANRALELMGRALGMFVDKVRHERQDPVRPPADGRGMVARVRPTEAARGQTLRPKHHRCYRRPQRNEDFWRSAMFAWIDRPLARGDQRSQADRPP